MSVSPLARDPQPRHLELHIAIRILEKRADQGQCVTISARMARMVARELRRLTGER